jgi:transposase InsO family protein
MTHAIENSCEPWHRRLAHINYKVLPYICKVITGLPKLKVDQEGICNGCAQRKNIKNPFPKRDSKAEGVLVLIHSDVCGPMPSSSISRYVYYVSFIDDYSRKTWIYFLKSKDEVFSKFKEFKALIENLSERKIKILRLDNGGEYTSKEFVSFCRDVGIKRELTTPYNPQQNSVARKEEQNDYGSYEDHDSRSRSSYVLVGRSSYGSCLCAEPDYPIVHLSSRPQKRCSPERSQR